MTLHPFLGGASPEGGDGFDKKKRSWFQIPPSTGFSTDSSDLSTFETSWPFVSLGFSLITSLSGGSGKKELLKLHFKLFWCRFVRLKNVCFSNGFAQRNNIIWMSKTFSFKIETYLLKRPFIFFIWKSVSYAIITEMQKNWKHDFDTMYDIFFNKINKSIDNHKNENA
jgi:hypothetical protein